jgi:ribosome-associated toxin RatA of RatAB toxin-antitoxin module
VPVVQAQILVHRRQEAVFDLAQNYGARLEWDPFLRAIAFQEGATQADVGVRVWVRANNGLDMEVVYVSMQRPRCVAMKMIRGPFFFERFAGTWRFDREDDERTRVTFRYGFATRWSWLRPALDRVIHAVFLRDIRARLEGLKRAAERSGRTDA